MCDNRSIPFPPEFKNDDLLNSLDLSIIDVETTGADLYGSDRICAIAVKRIKHGKVLKPFYSLVDPEMPILPSASAVNGITNFLIQKEKAPILDLISEQIAEYVGDSVRVAHNAMFDRSFVNPAIFLENGYTRTLWKETPEALKWSQQFGGKQGAEWLCTFRLAVHLMREHYQYTDIALSNEALRFWFEPQYIRTSANHNALADVETTYHNLRNLLSYAQHFVGIQSLDELFALQRENITSDIISWGKYKDYQIDEVPDDYLKWYINEYAEAQYETALYFKHHLAGRTKTHKAVKEQKSVSGTGIFNGNYSASSAINLRQERRFKGIVEPKPTMRCDSLTKEQMKKVKPLIF